MHVVGRFVIGFRYWKLLLPLLLEDIKRVSWIIVTTTVPREIFIGDSSQINSKSTIVGPIIEQRNGGFDSTFESNGDGSEGTNFIQGKVKEIIEGSNTIVGQ